MSLKIIHSPKPILFAIIAVIIIFLPIFSVTQPARSQAVATGTALREVNLRMNANGLTPITPPEDETTRKRSTPSGLMPFPVPGISLINPNFQKVGTWELDNIADVISIQQPVKFIIWLSTSSATSGDIKFTLKYGTVVVAGPTVLDANNIDTSAKRYEVSSHANLTTTDSGKPLGLEIESKINGDGVMIHYGGYQEDSGVSFMSDAVKFKYLHAGPKEFCVEFSDAFRAPVNDIYPIIFVDDMAVYDEDGNVLERTISENGNNLFKWKLKLLPGVHTFLVGIAYAKNRDINLTWNTQVSLKVVLEDNDRSWLQGMGTGDIIVMFLLMIGVLVFFISIFAVLSSRSSAKNVYVRRSPIPDRYRLIVKKKMDRFHMKPRPAVRSARQTGGKRAFHKAKKKK